MKLSEQWLREWCDPEADITALADVLTIGGLEVDAVDPLARPESVVVAEVIDVAKHPNADRLSLCRVSDGTEERQVVCGAPNVQAGMKTAYAPVGCVLPGGQKLKRAKIRGVESHGMLCSAAELALSDDAAGIIQLPASSTVGESLIDLLQLDDHVIDIALTPNRGDCFSVLGVARDLSALSGAPLAELIW